MEILESIIISDRRAEEASRKETTGRKVTTPIGRASWMRTPYDGGYCEISDRQENILSLNANRLFKFASRARQAQGEMGGFKKPGRCVIEEGAWQAGAFGKEFRVPRLTPNT